MDCKGYETQLLKMINPTILNKSDILVEMHQMYRPGCTQTLKERFSSTHVIEEIKGHHRSINDWPKKIKLLRYLYPTELLLDFMDEGRPYPMNWFYMKPKTT